MVRFEPLRTLSADGEALLRMRAAEHARDPEATLSQVRRALDARRLSAVCLYDDAGHARGLAAWRWAGAAHVHALVIIQYVQPVAPPALGAALVDYLFSELLPLPELAVIEGRLRDRSPGVREAWERHQAVRFERCRMVRVLGRVPVPIVATPDGFRTVPWLSDHMAGVEQVAAAAYAHSIDRVAVPEIAAEGAVALIYRLRAGERSLAGSWHERGSLVLLDGREAVVGYLAAARYGDRVRIVDLAVHPRYQRRGLGQVLVARALGACFNQGIVAVEWDVTTRNPARQLANRIGFQPVTCGEIGLWWRDGRQLPWCE